jgi:lipid-binding SYLF domain-containing protein
MRKLKNLSDKVDQARVTFESFMTDKNQAWLKENLNQAKGLIIIPSLLKAGFVFGGSGGSGVLIVKDEKTGQWSQPAFYTLGSGTLGLQIGAEAAEVIMMVRTQKAVDALFTSSFKLGGDTSVAVGPVVQVSNRTSWLTFFPFREPKALMRVYR